MKIALLTLRLYAPWSHSLKEKRSIVKSLIAKLRNKFNISVAESNEQDKHQTAELTIVALGANSAQCDSIMDNVINFAIEKCEAEIIDINRQIL